MEAETILKVVEDALFHRCFVIDVVISDYDSIM